MHRKLGGNRGYGRVLCPGLHTHLMQELNVGTVVCLYTGEICINCDQLCILEYASHIILQCPANAKDVNDLFMQLIAIEDCSSKHAFSAISFYPIANSSRISRRCCEFITVIIVLPMPN